MISRFIFGTESASWEEMDGLGGLTRFWPAGVFRGFQRSAFLCVVKAWASPERPRSIQGTA